MATKKPKKKQAKKISKAQATLSTADKNALRRIMKKVRNIRIYNLQHGK
jgi:hypothetical protein